MMLFRRRSISDGTGQRPVSSAEETVPPVPLPPSSPAPPLAEGDGPSAGATVFDVGAVVSIIGIGVVAAGQVRSGILRVGMKLRVRRSGVLPVPQAPVEIMKITITIPHKVELYRTQYGGVVQEVGPGVGVAVGVKGVSKNDLHAGDVLYQ